MVKCSIVSILALHTEGDGTACSYSPTHPTFLSSPSIRRATQDILSLPDKPAVSILALHTEGDAYHAYPSNCTEVSILALHTEGDHGWQVLSDHRWIVSILALHTEGDHAVYVFLLPGAVSILALHTEGDAGGFADFG